MAGLLAAIAWTAAACTRNSYISPHPGTKSYYTFFVRSAQGGVIRKFAGKNSPRALKKLPRTVLWVIGDSAKTSTGALVRFYLQNLRLTNILSKNENLRRTILSLRFSSFGGVFDENEDFANWDLIGVAALL